jgi:hypothetical protein
MDDRHVDRWTRALAGRPDRRSVWRGLVGGPVAALLAGADRAPAAVAQEAAAKRCSKDGKTCGRDNQCCSGQCKGTECRPAKGQGTCTIRRDFCKTGLDGTDCGTTDDGNPCTCLVTTRGASFCGGVASQCAPCANDADCTEVTGPGSACVRTVGTPACGENCLEEGGTACSPPCVED